MWCPGSGSVSAMGLNYLPRTRSCSFVPSHWRCRSPFFQIISFLAPEFTNWDSAFPTQPLHLVSQAVGTSPLKKKKRNQQKKRLPVI